MFRQHWWRRHGRRRNFLDWRFLSSLNQFSMPSPSPKNRWCQRTLTTCISKTVTWEGREMLIYSTLTQCLFWHSTSTSTPLHERRKRYHAKYSWVSRTWGTTTSKCVSMVIMSLWWKPSPCTWRHSRARCAHPHLNEHPLSVFNKNSVLKVIIASWDTHYQFSIKTRDSTLKRGKVGWEPHE